MEVIWLKRKLMDKFAFKLGSIWPLLALLLFKIFEGLMLQDLRWHRTVTRVLESVTVSQATLPLTGVLDAMPGR